MGRPGRHRGRGPRRPQHGGPARVRPVATRRTLRDRVLRRRRSRDPSQRQGRLGRRERALSVVDRDVRRPVRRSPQAASGRPWSRAEPVRNRVRASWASRSSPPGDGRSSRSPTSPTCTTWPVRASRIRRASSSSPKESRPSSTTTFAWLVVVLAVVAFVGIWVISIGQDNPNDYAFAVLVVVCRCCSGGSSTACHDGEASRRTSRRF
jgi:cobalamin biosynthesis Mg chelatase CobN